MENTITLTSGQKIEVLMQDEVSLDIDCSLRYIESGKKEVEEYVENVSKLKLDTIIQEAKNKMDEQITQGVIDAQEKASASAKDVIDENIASMKDEINQYLETSVIPNIETAKSQADQSAQTAVQAASQATTAYNNLSNSLDMATEVACGNIGDIKYSLRTSAPHGGVICNGQILSEEQYPDLYQMLVDNRLEKVSADEYERQVAETGNCFFFSINESDKTIKVPTIITSDDNGYMAYAVCYTGKDTEIDITQEIELNNPFSLLDYKWSEYELNNASWLLSDGQFNSGATYISVYNLLLEIYNGTVTKEGVSVKLSTEAYTDTDFVINTADTTFRLPINVKLASGNAVVGNGKVLGLTNGVSYFSLATRKAEISGYDYSLMGGAVGIYGQSVGSTDITSWRNVSEGVGVTTSEKSSGIETSSSGLKLYFYVGETIQDANIIVASQVLTEISKKTDKVQASEASMPSTKYTDLTLGASGSTYTAPANGWFALSKKATAVGQYIQLYKPLYSSLYASTTTSSSLITYLPVSKGTNIEVYYSAGGETNYFRFIYAEGEAN